VDGCAKVRCSPPQGDKVRTWLRDEEATRPTDVHRVGLPRQQSIPDACSRLGCPSILVRCWNSGRIANAATGTSTRHPRTCLSARTSAPGAATARRTSCTASVRTAAASSSGAPSARPACSLSTRHRPSGLSGQDALRHPPADPLAGEQEPTRPAPSPPGTGSCGRHRPW
jgi:hypothetical protein